MSKVIMLRNLMIATFIVTTILILIGLLLDSILVANIAIFGSIIVVIEAIIHSCYKLYLDILDVKNKNKQKHNKHKN